MKTDNGESVSVWMATPDTRVDGPLATNLDVDVCVVGAGLAGITTAYLLSLEQQRVAILDTVQRGRRDLQDDRPSGKRSRRLVHRDRAIARQGGRPRELARPTCAERPWLRSSGSR